MAQSFLLQLLKKFKQGDAQSNFGLILAMASRLTADF
jgi:hypothetical protein